MALATLSVVGQIGTIAIQETEQQSVVAKFTVTVIKDKLEVPFDFVAYGKLAQRIFDQQKEDDVVALTASLISTKEDQYWQVNNLSGFGQEGTDSYAQVTVGGTIRTEPTTQDTANGKRITKLAIPVSVTGGPSHWFNFVAFNSQSQIIEKWYSKNTFAVVTGDYSPSQSKEGTLYHSWVVRSIEKPFEASSGTQSSASSTKQKDPVLPPTETIPDEIPF